MKNKQDVSRSERSDAFVDRALQEYQRELISLGRLTELLGVDYKRTFEIVLSREMQLRYGPTSREEVLQEFDTHRNISNGS